MNKSTFKPVEESKYGVYVWRMPDGRFVSDGDGNFLNIPSEKFDLSKMKALREAVNYYGITEGEAVFLSGRRRVTDSEYEEQQERMVNGLTPDPYDAGALADELRYKKQHG